MRSLTVLVSFILKIFVYIFQNFSAIYFILFFIRGLDFRPDYQKVGILQSILDSPVLALSAAITSSIRKYIDRVLGLQPTETCVVAVVPNR